MLSILWVTVQVCVTRFGDLLALLRTCTMKAVFTWPITEPAIVAVTTLCPR